MTTGQLCAQEENTESSRTATWPCGEIVIACSWDQEPTSHLMVSGVVVEDRPLVALAQTAQKEKGHRDESFQLPSSIICIKCNL